MSTIKYVLFFVLFRNQLICCDYFSAKIILQLNYNICLKMLFCLNSPQSSTFYELTVCIHPVGFFLLF